MTPKLSLPNDIYDSWLTPHLASWQIFAIAAALAFIVFAAIYFYLARRKKTRVVGEPPLNFDSFLMILKRTRWELPPSVDRSDLLRLESLRVVNLISEVLKGFLGWRFDLHLKDKTTGELWRALQGRQETEKVESLVRVLRECDKVKFQDNQIILGSGEATRLIEESLVGLRALQPALSLDSSTLTTGLPLKQNALTREDL